MLNSLRITALLILLEIGGCSGGGSRQEAASDAYRQPQPQAKQQPTASQEAEVPIERKLIKRGTLEFETSNVESSHDLITQTVAELGGYIAEDNIYDRDDRLTHILEIRVPADHFDELLRRISENAQNIERKQISVDDVTEEYVDLEARIQSKEALFARYEQLLQQANTVSEMLQIEKEMGALREELESIEGRLRYLKDQVAFSTLRVEYYERQSSSVGFASKFVQALGKGWNNFLLGLVGLAQLWPLLILLVAGVLLYRRRRKRKQARKS